VATVVMKLLNLVQPQRAYFGEKDAQQLAILRRMALDLDLPVEIVAVPTVREADGLALSSRNLRLTAEQRAAAPALYRALCEARKALDEGEESAAEARRRAMKLLPEREDARLEYFEIADAETLQPVERVTGRVLIAAAYWMGAVRLIDNVTWPGRN
jgi:pantoate--beta-alanine ligase